MTQIKFEVICDSLNVGQDGYKRPSMNVSGASSPEQALKSAKELCRGCVFWSGNAGSPGPCQGFDTVEIVPDGNVVVSAQTGMKVRNNVTYAEWATIKGKNNMRPECGKQMSPTRWPNRTPLTR